MDRSGLVAAALGTRRKYLWLALGVVGLALWLGVGLAKADGYWNVWQGNLPGSSGNRAVHSVCDCGDGYEWWVRLSWNDSHTMNFSWIGNDGAWHNKDALIYGQEYTEYYDRLYGYYYFLVSSGVAQGGCENPSGMATVYTNCRNATTY